MFLGFVAALSQIEESHKMGSSYSSTSGGVVRVRSPEFRMPNCKNCGGGDFYHSPWGLKCSYCRSNQK